MFYKDWNIIYKKIVQNLDLQFDKDLIAADILNKILDRKKIVSIKEVKKIISDKEVFVFGAGPSLESSIDKYRNEYLDKVKISVDGTTSALLEKNILPDVIITDLDGKISDQIKSNKEGSLVIIHAHGDNIDKIKRYLPKFKGKIIGTTQNNPKPFKNLHNFGGFTDGDRAVFFADFFNAKKICLIGFDFNCGIGKYSFSEKKDKPMKLKKLKWCNYLVNILKKDNENIQEL